MDRLRSSAAYRIAFTYSAACALAILLLGVAVYFAADADFRRQQDAGLAEESRGLVREFEEGGMADIAKAIAKRERGVSAYGYAIFDGAGRRVAGSLETSRPDAGSSDIIFTDPIEGPDPAQALGTDLPGGYRLVVARDTEELEGIDRTILILFGGAFLFVLALGLVGALILGGYLRRRLSGISDAARAIIAGELDRRVPLGPHHDEFDQAGRALNTMLDRINQLMDNLRQVSSDVAHDLRTPLLRLRNQLEQVGSVDGAAAKAIEQGDAVLALFAAILRIAEVESGALSRTFAAIDLSALATDLGESYQPAFADGGRELDWSIKDGIMVCGDRELIAQALINLLDNARIHTPPGTRVRVALEAGDDWAQLSVADDGPGVPAGDHDRILQRFARGEASRTTPGNGLGLSLVVAVAAAHGGNVAVGANAPGLRVTIIMPRAWS
ncbi:HAMP domain-containing sensor histidine kinase [Sphingobium aquiterrae]|uniref:sensor histidine kinase n=1 Tax=Sphingobium aquiterrae TaxID=2038656 RepID=UPI003015C0BE